ncbi:MAG: hypothetical protein GY796_34080 [Chloroflexi bacterium]|nr:hypothetical protein [Chloroflexota bacterium]
MRHVQLCRTANQPLALKSRLVAARAMQAGLDILRPHLVGSATVQSAGTAVISAVKGDIRDIGKNLVIMMMEGAGFEMIDLGIGRSAAHINETFAEQIEADAYCKCGAGFRYG